MERALKEALKKSQSLPVRPVTAKTMATIRSRGTRSTEWALRMRLVRSGFRGWTLHPSHLAARPDFYFGVKRIAVFVDGCFWHNCPKCGHTPKIRNEFWTTKFELNKRRDRRDTARLRRDGIAVVRIWEHQLATSEWRRRILQAARKKL